MPKVAQILARHSTITLTMDRYTHVDQQEVAEAMNTLPSFVGPRDPSPGESGSRHNSVCTLFAQTPVPKGHQEASCGNDKGKQCDQFEKSQSVDIERLGTCCHREASRKEERRRPDSNRGIADLQSADVNSQCLAGKSLATSEKVGLHTICTLGLHVPPELIPLIENWAQLPEQIRKAILALSGMDS